MTSHHRSYLSVVLAVLMLSTTGIPSWAQTAPTQTQPAPVQAPARPARPADEDALQKAAAIKDHAERTEALVKVVNDFPRAPYIRNNVFYLVRPLKPLYTEPEKVRPLVVRFVEGTSTATAYARTEFYHGIAKELFNNDILLDLAEDLAKKGVALLDEAGYVENERRSHEQREAYYNQRDPKRKAEEFSVAQAKEKFRAFRGANYAFLGRIYLKRDKTTEAEATLREAYRIVPSVDAATGLADIFEKRGNDKEALEYMGAAALSGRLTASGVDRLHTLYRKLNKGSLEGLEASLDARFRKNFSSPLRVEPYKPPAGRESGSVARSVLAEFVTGAGCDPCISADLSFDAALERYSRRELVLLVYHMHAPTSDPLSNHSAQARHAFYEAQGAPTIYLDGKLTKPGEGLRTEAERVWKNLDAAILSRLDTPAEAQIKISAVPEGSKVKVDVTVDATKNSSPDLRVQLALVENEVSYSGENGLRFHPMVVRNLARKSESEGYGFKVNPNSTSNVGYVFDIEQIEAANLKYYDEYAADMKKRLGDRITISFKEKRYLIDPKHLSVVAFVQDEKTKAILQASYLKVGK